MGILPEWDDQHIPRETFVTEVQQFLALAQADQDTRFIKQLQLRYPSQRSRASAIGIMAAICLCLFGPHGWLAAILLWPVLRRL